MWDKAKQSSLLRDLLERGLQNHQSMASASLLYNEGISDRYTPYYFPWSVKRSVQPASLPIRDHCNLTLLTDLGCVISINESVMTSVLRYVVKDQPLTTKGVMRVLVRMANTEPISDISSQLLL